MNTIRLGVFDIFGRIIPGIVIIILISLSINYLNFSQLLGNISSLSISALLAYAAFAFFVGFILDILGSYFQRIFGKLLFGEQKHKVIDKIKGLNPDFNAEHYNILFLDSFAEIKSPGAREKADGFRAFCHMSRNLSLAFLIYGLLTLGYNVINFKTGATILSVTKIISAFLISYLLLSRAIHFRREGDKYLLCIYHILSKDSNEIKTKNKVDQ